MRINSNYAISNRIFTPVEPAIKERIILGIDPGTAVMGYGVIKETGSKIELLSLGIVKIPAGDDHMIKLQRIFEKNCSPYR